MILMVNCSLETNWSPVQGDIMTRWAAKVKPGKTLQEYPRPQFTRNAWKNLNGLWEYAIRPNSENPPDSLDGKILVPFSIEAPLSGVGRQLETDEAIWYKRILQIPEDWKDNTVLLHFEASDFETTVWLNSEKIGHHRGGYQPFYFSIDGSQINEKAELYADDPDFSKKIRE